MKNHGVIALEKILKAIQDEAFRVELHKKQGILTEQEAIQEMLALSWVRERTEKIKHGVESMPPELLVV